MFNGLSSRWWTFFHILSAWVDRENWWWQNPTNLMDLRTSITFDVCQKASVFQNVLLQNIFMYNLSLMRFVVMLHKGVLHTFCLWLHFWFQAVYKIPQCWLFLYCLCNLSTLVRGSLVSARSSIVCLPKHSSSYHRYKAWTVYTTILWFQKHSHD